MITDYENVGYIKFSGETVTDGVIDASSAGNALLGLDGLIRYFNNQQTPELAKVDYEIPVQTQEGSWIAYILGAIGVGSAAFTLSYLKKAGEKLAENDFKDIGLKDVFRKSLNALIDLVKLIKHTEKSSGWDAGNLYWRNNNSEVGIKNLDGEIIFLPTEYFRWYKTLPVGLLGRITVGVTKDRNLSIGNSGDATTDEVIINYEDKHLFFEAASDEEEDFLLPELEHGKFVKLEGKLIRGNEAANSVGLEFQGHVINCHPDAGNVRRYKPALFLRCIVEGEVTRHTKQRWVVDKRPTIIISRVTPLEDDGQTDLF